MAGPGDAASEPTPRLRVGVLFGGRSGEHDVSLHSAKAVMAALQKAGHEVVPIGITREGRWLVGGDPLHALRSGDAGGEQSVTMLPEPGGTGLVRVADERSQLAINHATHSVGKLDLLSPVLHGTYGEDGT